MPSGGQTTAMIEGFNVAIKALRQEVSGRSLVTVSDGIGMLKMLHYLPLPPQRFLVDLADSSFGYVVTDENTLRHFVFRKVFGAIGH